MNPTVTPVHCAPDTWIAMYLEAEKLSEEVLELYPRDEAAQSNAVAARKMMMSFICSCRNKI